MRFLILFLAISSIVFSSNYLSNCTNISYPGDYVLSDDLHFAKTPRTSWDRGDVCLRITSDNVNLNCNGHYIIGSDENDTYGIYTYDTQNFSLKNCNVSSFNTCINLHDSYHVSIDRNSLFCRVLLGDFPINSSSEVSITNNFFINSSLFDEMSANLTVINNTFTNGGIYVGLDSNSIVFGNTITHNSSYCSAFGSSAIGAVVSNNSFFSLCSISLDGEGLVFSNNSISSGSFNGLYIAYLKNSQIINNTVCSPSLNRSTSYTNKYFDIYGAWEGNKNIYLNNTCDTSNPQHICTKSCSGSDNLSKSNCPLSFLLLSIIFLFVLRGKIQ